MTTTGRPSRKPSPFRLSATRSRAAPFLRTQLSSEPIRLLLLNGRQVIDAVPKALGVRLNQEGKTVSDAAVTTQFYTWRFGEVGVIGWSTNLQSSFGATNMLRVRIAQRVRQLGEQQVLAGAR